MFATGLNIWQPAVYGALGRSIIFTAPQGQTNYLAEGDSITRGAYVTTAYPKLYADAYLGRINFLNLAISGEGIDQLQARIAADIARATAIPWASANIMTLYVGINNSPAGPYPLSASAFLTKLFTYCDAVRAAGWKLIVGTIMPCYNSASHDTWRNSINPSIRASIGTHCDAVMDFAADPTIGPDGASASAYWNVDHLHPSDAGNAIMGTIQAAAVNALTIAVAEPAQYSAWNPADKAALITLSGANFIAGNNTSGGFASVRSTASRDSGKYVAHFLLGGTIDGLFGLANKVEALNNYFGQIAPAAMYGQAYGGMFAPGCTVVNNPAGGIVVGHYGSWWIDHDAGKAWLADNNTFFASGNPATGANPTVTFPPNTMFWLGFSPQTSASSVQLPANAAALPYPLVSGYSAF